MNNMAKLPFELSVPIFTRPVEAPSKVGHCGVLTGLAAYCGRQVACMATVRPYGFPEPPGAFRKCRSIGGSYGSYANLINGRFCVNLAAAALLSEWRVFRTRIREVGRNSENVNLL